MTFSTYYDSNDTGLSGPTNVAGTLISFLDKTLANGYNGTTLTTLTSVGTLCTATLTSHGYRDRQWVTISGVTPSQYNGTWQIITGSTTTNTFQFNVSSSPGSSATGTIACIVAPLGWTKSFSGTNLATYRQLSGNQLYLHIDDTGTTTARGIGYEVMTDINTGINPFPTTPQLASGIFISKSNAVTIRRAILWGNSSIFYMFVDYTGDSSSGTLWAFGDGTTYKPITDSWFTVLFGQSAAGTFEGSAFLAPGAAGTAFSSLAAHFIARSFTAITGSVTSNKIVNFSFANLSPTIAAVSQMGGSTGTLTYPIYADGNLWTSQILIYETSPAVRGALVGILAPMHSRPLTDYSIFSGLGTLTGKEYMVINLGVTGQIFAEISNTF